MATPNIRFAGFEGDWEEKSLKDCVSINSGKDYKHLNPGSIPVYGTGGYMLSVDQSLSETDAVGIGRKGTIDKPYILKAPFWTVDTLFYAIPNHTFDLHFVHATFQKVDWKLLDESTGVPSLSKSVIGKVKVLIPLNEEQQKIGSCFAALDRKIATHQAKCDQLKVVKQFMLQNMFPKAGEQQPEIRFDGFVGDWQLVKLGDIADIVGGGTPSTSKAEFWNGDINWFAPAELNDKVFVSSSERKITHAGLKNSGAQILPEGSVLFTSRAGIGKTAILLTPACTNQGFQSIVPKKDKLDSYFIYSRTEELKKYGNKVGAGSTFIEVSRKQMASMPLLIPTSMAEQQKIGSYFAALDRKIAAQQAKCDQLKVIKQFMLQNMFC